SVTPTADGLSVELEIQRKATNDLRQCWDTLISTITLTLKYEGKVDGKDRFSLISVDSKAWFDPGDQTHWNHGNEVHDYSGLNLHTGFDTKNESLQKQFTNFTYSADPIREAQLEAEKAAADKKAAEDAERVRQVYSEIEKILKDRGYKDISQLKVDY